MTLGRCQAIGCRAVILQSEVFCAKHLVMVEPDTRRLLGKTFRVTPKQTASFGVHLQRAIQEVLFYQTNGHRFPSDRAFEWDDA